MMPLIKYMMAPCTQCFRINGICEPSLEKPCPDPFGKREKEDLALSPILRKGILNVRKIKTKEAES